MTIITLLTDFGTQDAYVAQMKGQILRGCPDAQLVDVTHAVPAQDIQAGAFLLAQSVPFFPAGTVHLAIIDPGVGTSRRMIAAEVLTQDPDGEAYQLQRLVLPDNGLISILLQHHSLVGAHYLTNQAFWRPGVSHTFHGRDIMGPIAAAWASGARRADFGPECSAPVHFELNKPVFQGNSIAGQAILLDHFGNVITNIAASVVRELVRPGHSATVEIDGGSAQRVAMVNTYGQCESGELTLLIGSHGYLELACSGGNAVRRLDVRRHSIVRIAF